MYGDQRMRMNDVCVIFSYGIGKLLKRNYIKKSNQIYHREITCSNSATEYKNIDRTRHCSIISVELEQVYTNV